MTNIQFQMYQGICICY